MSSVTVCALLLLSLQRATWREPFAFIYEYIQCSSMGDVRFSITAIDWEVHIVSEVEGA